MLRRPPAGHRRLAVEPGGGVILRLSSFASEYPPDLAGALAVLRAET